jgi:hypothetical protein
MFGLFKKKAIKINNKQNLVDTLTRIVEILEANGHNAQADAVNKPLQYLHQDDVDNFLKHFKTVDIWGGSGAAWEVGTFKTKQVEREFENCFIRLSELLKETGIKFKPANQIASIFKSVLRQDQTNGY